MIDHFTLVQQALAQLDHDAVQRAIEIIKAAKQRGSMVFICGNGGSAATASHFSCDLQKAAGVRAIALTDNVPLITAWANDSDYMDSFRKQGNALAAGGDVVIVISCSGASPSIYRAIDIPARDCIALFGRDAPWYPGENMEYEGNSVMIAIRVNSIDYGVIEDVHLSICHAITKGVADASI